MENGWVSHPAKDHVEADPSRGTNPIPVVARGAEAASSPSVGGSRPLRILHLDSERGWSGGQTQVSLLLRHLVGGEFSNALVSPEGSALLERCRGEGLPTFAVRMRHYADVSSVIRLGRIFRGHRPDIIHMHSSTAHFLGVWARRLVRSNAATVFTRRMDYRLRRAVVMRLPYIFLTDRVVAISQGVRRALVESGIPDRRIEVVSSAVDLERFQPFSCAAAERRALGIPERAPVLGVVGGLIRRKGHRYLFEAMVPVLRRFPDAILLVVGDGPLRAPLERLAAELGISGGVRFAGQVEDVRRPLACLDVLVLPSVAEGLGVSLLEGMAMGLPLVGSDVGGIPDVVRDGVTGCLVPPRDPAALAERLLAMLADPDLRRAMGRAARQLVAAEFAADTMARRYEALYRNAANDRATRGACGKKGG